MVYQGCEEALLAALLTSSFEHILHILTGQWIMLNSDYVIYLAKSVAIGTMIGY